MQKSNESAHPLKKARLDLGYTQAMLADFAQVGKATIQRAERGEVLRPDSVRQICNYFSECYQRRVFPQELGLVYEWEEAEQTPIGATFEPRPSPHMGYSHLQRKSVGSKEMVLKTAKFLTLTVGELIERYAHEKP